MQLCCHLSNFRVELNTAEKEDTYSVTPHWLNQISKVCSASYQVSFFFSYQDANGIVNIAGPLRGTGAPWRCKQGDRYEGAVGDWFLLRGWQMVMLTDRESDYSELWRWTSACVSWFPWQPNHSQSGLHRSHAHISWHSVKTVPLSKGGHADKRVPSVTTRSVHLAAKPWNWRSKLRCESLLASYFLWRAFHVLFIFWGVTFFSVLSALTELRTSSTLQSRNDGYDCMISTV